jgi:hypothetical protein
MLFDFLGNQALYLALARGEGEQPRLLPARRAGALLRRGDRDRRDLDIERRMSVRAPMQWSSQLH